jgi:Esterase-like activity of phytase
VRKFWHTALIAASLGLFAASSLNAQVNLIALGSLTESKAGTYADLSGLDGVLENGAPANLLGGLGSGLAWAGVTTFLGLPDRGPNAVVFDALVDNTVTYIPRFHTIKMNLDKNKGAGLPFTLTPKLKDTTLLYSSDPLVYGTGAALAVGPGAPDQNRKHKFYFSGRSDNFDPSRNSGNPRDARLDTESIRISNNGNRVYISDEYGPCVYEFDRWSGERTRAFKLPDNLFVTNLQPIGTDEIIGNTSGRTANKGMEGLAITPDGKTLVGIMQAALIQDNLLGGPAKKLLRIVNIDINSGKTQEYAYLLTTGSGVSDIVALNQHEFLVDERDGDGRGSDTAAKVKQIFKIDLKNAVDITDLDGTTAATFAVPKFLFLDVVAVLGANGITPDQVPAKLEGLALGADVKNGRTKLHTLWLANDNDFLQDFDAPGANPNQFFVFGFTDADLAGSKFVPQKLR